MTWLVTDAITVNRREIVPGTELTIVSSAGRWGRFRFIRHITTETGVEWIDVYGGPKGHETIRSFRPNQIKTVHRDRKMRVKA